MKRESKSLSATVLRVVTQTVPGEIQAWLKSDDDGEELFLRLPSPPASLRAALREGARVLCRATPTGRPRKVFWIDAVYQPSEGDTDTEVWRATTRFVPRERGVKATEQSGVSRLPRNDTVSVWGTVTRLARRPNLLTEGAVLPDDGGSLVELRLRRAPLGLLTALAEGARVLCLAAPHVRDPSLRFASRILRVELQQPDGAYREVWHHGPEDGAEDEEARDEVVGQ